MVLHPLAAVAAAGFGLRDDGLIMSAIAVAEHLSEVAAGLETVARWVGG